MNLALYYLPGCADGARVRRTAHEQGLRLQLLDTSRDRVARQELMEARGLSETPVLRIEARGRVERIAGAEAILQFLEQVAAVRNASA